MREVRDAAANRLLGLSPVTDLLGTFRGVPSVFAGSPIPPSVVGRYIVIRDAHIDEAWETKQSDTPDGTATIGRTVEFDVAAYQDQTGDTSDLEDLSRIIRDAFHRHQLAVSGYGTLIAKASGPVEAPGSEEEVNQVEGRIVTVNLTIIKRN